MRCYVMNPGGPTTTKQTRVEAMAKKTKRKAKRKAAAKRAAPARAPAKKRRRSKARKHHAGTTAGEGQTTMATKKRKGGKKRGGKKARRNKAKNPGSPRRKSGGKRKGARRKAHRHSRKNPSGMMSALIAAGKTVGGAAIGTAAIIGTEAFLAKYPQKTKGRVAAIQAGVGAVVGGGLAAAGMPGIGAAVAVTGGVMAGVTALSTPGMADTKQIAAVIPPHQIQGVVVRDRDLLMQAVIPSFR